MAMATKIPIPLHYFDSMTRMRALMVQLLQLTFVLMTPRPALHFNQGFLEGHIDMALTRRCFLAFTIPVVSNKLSSSEAAKMLDF